MLITLLEIAALLGFMIICLVPAKSKRKINVVYKLRPDTSLSEYAVNADGYLEHTCQPENIGH